MKDTNNVNKPIKFLFLITGLKYRPCSFFLEGNCRRAGCRFAHDLSRIPCRFWEEGQCLKEEDCPFLHGYPR